MLRGQVRLCMMVSFCGILGFTGKRETVGETDFNVAFSNLGAMESPSARFGIASKSILKSDFDSVEAGAGLASVGVRGASASRPDFNGSTRRRVELPEKRYVMLKKTMRARTTVRVRCCRRAMATGDEGVGDASFRWCLYDSMFTMTCGLYDACGASMSGYRLIGGR